MGMKKIVVMLWLIFLCMSVAPVQAEDFVIRDYTFTWHVIKIGGTTLEIQKTPEALVVIFGRSGIPLCALTVFPVQANAVGDMLKRTNDYYEIQKKSEDLTSTDALFSHNCVVTFSSKQGRGFEVRVKQDEPFSPVVLMEREEAMEIGKYLRQAEQMASFADKRVRP